MSVVQNFIDVHKRLMRRWSDAFRAGFAHQLSAPKIKVEILNGLLGETCHSYQQNSLTISGRYETADVFLHDKELENSSVQLQFSTSLIGPVVSANVDTPGVSINGTALDAETASKIFVLPATLKIKGVDVRLTSPSQRMGERVRRISNFRSRGQRKRDFSTIVADIFVVVACALTLFFAWPWLTEKLAYEPIAEVEPQDPESVARNSELALNFFSQELVKAELSGYVTPIIRDRSIVASGSIPDTFEQRWEAVLIAYDESPNHLPLITKVDRMAAKPDVPPVTLVRLGEDAAVFFKDGSKRKLNETVKGQWKIENIAQNQIVLRSGTRKYTLKF